MMVMMIMIVMMINDHDGDDDHGDDNGVKTQMWEIHRCFQAPTIYNCFHSKYCAQALPNQSQPHHRAATFQ